MASKNDVARSEVAKVRKNLAPGVGSVDPSAAQPPIQQGKAQDPNQLSKATRAKIAELKRQAQQDGTFPSTSAANLTTQPVNVTNNVANNGANGKSVRNLRATTGVSKAALGAARANSTPVKVNGASTVLRATTQANPTKSANNTRVQHTASLKAPVATRAQQQPQPEAKQSAQTKSAAVATTAEQALRAAQLKAAVLKSRSANNNQSNASPGQKAVPQTQVTVPPVVTHHAPVSGITPPAKQLVPMAKKEAPTEEAPKPKQERKSPIINATALLAAKYPNYFADSNDTRTKAETRTVFVVASLILTLIAFGWMNWNAINFQIGGDFTYNSGLVGGITMLIVLIYALRKRLKLLRRAGNMEAWYYFHLFGGVLGPFVIIFHTGFTIKSINSGVALFTMITIVLSGVFGRYIYPRIGYSLHRKLLEIKESETHLMDVLHSYETAISERIERRLSNFALSILTGQSSILKLPMRLLAIRGAATACYVKVSNDVTAMVKTRAKLKGMPELEVKSRINREKEQLRQHIGSLANIAHAHLFERILVKWRILHIPLLYILVITSLFHVLAVHMY